jgi:GT2 family glycosyltransferase
VEPDWLTPLVDALDADPQVGAACPKILFAEPGPDGAPVINNVGNELGPTWELHDRGYGEVDRGQFDREEDVWAWCGAAVLLRGRYLDEVGRFDERLFMYAEDADLAWRGARRGWRYRYVPTSVIHHLHRASSGGERTPLLDHLNRRNRLVVVTRHGGARAAVGAWTRAVGGILAAVGTDLLAPLLRRRRPDLAPLRRRVRAAVDAARLLAGGHPPLP